MTKGKKNILQFFSFILKLLYYIVIFFVCLLCGFLVFYIISSQINANNENYKPKISLYTIVSPSMNPVIEVYDIVVNVRPDSEKDIEIGDIITYKSKAPNSEGMTITHRVVSIVKNGNKTEYITQGDNNENPDSIFVDYDSIIGEEILIIPKVGELQFLIAEQKGWLFLLLVPVAFFIFKDAYRLIELFGLKRKVDKVAGYVETTSIEKKKYEEQARKEKIKKQLEEKHVIKDSLVKSKYEDKGFLEEYSETIVKVDKNRYTKSLKTNVKKTSEKQPLIKEEQIEPKEIITEKVPVKKEKPVIVYEQFEILDTDELTTKIKEYDKKISELDKMLQDLENVKREPEVVEEETFVEEDNYLKESKIKVISVEETKTRKRARTQQEEIPKPKQKVEVVELKSLVQNNSVEKINITPKKSKKKRLNLKNNEPVKKPVKKGLIIIEKTKNRNK